MLDKGQALVSSVVEAIIAEVSSWLRCRDAMHEFGAFCRCDVKKQTTKRSCSHRLYAFAEVCGELDHHIIVRDLRAVISLTDWWQGEQSGCLLAQPDFYAALMSLVCQP